MLRIFSTRACLIVAAALHVSAAALSAQSSDSVQANASGWRITRDSAMSTWADRYASMLGMGADQGGLPPSTPDLRIARMRATRVSLDSLRARSALLAASRRTECPMPVAKLDTSRVAEMKVMPRDSGPSSPWAEEGRLIGCTNPLADSPR